MHKLNRHEEALEVFNRALELFPGEARTLKNRNAALTELRWVRREGAFGGFMGLIGVVSGVAMLITTLVIGVLLVYLFAPKYAWFGVVALLYAWAALVITSESFSTRPVLLWMLPYLSWNWK